MSDYYDRLEEQLARATARGVPRRQPLPRLGRPRPRWQWLGAAAAAAVCAAVALAVIFGVRGASHHQRAVTPGHHHPQLPVIHNYAPGKVPALGGQLYCDATFKPPRGTGSAKATIVVNQGGASYVYSLTGRGLKPAPAGETYEVWTIPEANGAFGGHQLQRGVAPTLLGVIAPPVAADGLLAARGTIPLSYTGTYRVLITVQPRAAKSHGRVVLRADVPL